MKQVLQHVRKRSLQLTEVPEPGIRNGGVLVRNSVSLISAGTEKMVIDFANKSMIGKAQERPDLVKQVMDKVKKDGLGPTIQTVLSRLDEPIPLGYSCAGIVEEVGRGAEEFAVGDRVACAGMGYASHAELNFIPKNLAVAVPAEVSLEDAAFVTLGAIALQGVRISNPSLGENVAVIGLGLLGLLTIQILKANGCRTLGIDLDPAKVALALELGSDTAIARTADVKAAIAAFTDGVGADAVIIAAATDSNDPIELSADISRRRGRVTMVGAVRMDVPRKPFYEKELELRLSMSYGPGRYDPSYEEQGHDYPIGYVRWTQRRNMQEFLRLVSRKQVTPARLVSHTFPIDRAESAYQVVTGQTKVPFTGVLLTYPRRSSTPGGRTVHLPAARKAARGEIGIGFIGAGNFARATLLPRFAKAKEARLHGIATASGRSAQTTGERFGFAYATTDSSRLLSDPAITAVVIATRHGSHARLAAQALRAGKAVFVEKPLAIDQAGLDEVTAALTPESLLTVGFNRRFSPLALQLKNAFGKGTSLAINYRINAGPIPAESWVHDPGEGGGRIIGEVCHFLDFVQYVTDELPVEVFAHALSGMEGKLHDTVAITVKLSGGSIASVDYFATGDKSFPKEHVEVYGGGRIAVLDDFRQLTIIGGGKSQGTKKLVQAKGYDEEVDVFLGAVRGAGPAPIPLESIIATTVATFAIENSLRSGAPVGLIPG